MSHGAKYKNTAPENQNTSHVRKTFIKTHWNMIGEQTPSRHRNVDRSSVISGVFLFVVMIAVLHST